MKKKIIFQTICAAAAGLMTVGFPSRAQTQSQCTVESKDQYYRAFLESHEGQNKDEARALELAKKYLSCPYDSADKEDVLAKLNLAVGRMLSLKNLNTEAIPYFIKAASYNSIVRTSPQTYAYLAEAYQEVLTPMADVFNSRFAGKHETDESLIALKNINQLVDRIIDAYARAVAMSGIEPSPRAHRPRYRDGRSTPTGPTDWIDDLTELYMDRHKGSDRGLKKLIKTILSQPLPPEPTPITSLPREKRKNP